jgi:hypothetical protein
MVTYFLIAREKAVGPSRAPSGFCDFPKNRAGFGKSRIGRRKRRFFNLPR